jgi:hypothetical protein
VLDRLDGRGGHAGYAEQRRHQVAVVAHGHPNSLAGGRAGGG